MNMNATDNIVQIRPFSRYQCSKCGIDAACDCGAPMVAKAEQVREKKKANPDQSIKSIAREVGTSPANVRKALEVGGYISPQSDDDEFDPDLAVAQTKQAFIARAAQAEADAKFFGEVDAEVIGAARETATAWNKLVSEIEEKMQ